MFAKLIDNWQHTPAFRRIQALTPKKIATVDDSGRDRVTLLQLACLQGDLPLVKTLLANYKNLKLNPNEVDDRGFSPLYCAAQNGYEEIVRLLLEAGASVYIHAGSNPRLKSPPLKPLNVAFDNRQIKVMKLLIARGADSYEFNSGKEKRLTSMFMRGYALIWRSLDEEADHQKKMRYHHETTEALDFVVALSINLKKILYLENTPPTDLDEATFERIVNVIEKAYQGVLNTMAEGYENPERRAKADQQAMQIAHQLEAEIKKIQSDMAALHKKETTYPFSFLTEARKKLLPDEFKESTGKRLGDFLEAFKRDLSKEKLSQVERKHD